MPRIAGHFFYWAETHTPRIQQNPPQGRAFCKWRAVEGVLCAPLELHRRS